MYKEAATGKTNTTHINNIAILEYSIVSFNRGIKFEFNKTLKAGRALKTSQKRRQKISCTILTRTEFRSSYNSH